MTSAVDNSYDTWFNPQATNHACGIKTYWLGGCDAGGYINTKYENLDTNSATMT